MRTNSVKVLTLCLLTISLVAGCSDDSLTNPEPGPGGPRYNEVSFKQTHNSYSIEMPIEEQLAYTFDRPWEGGARGLELDIWVHETHGSSWQWCVDHDGPYTSSAEKQLSKYLKRLLTWSDEHPQHGVITVMIELKDGVNSDYQEFFPEKFDQYLSEHFDPHRLFTPADLMRGRTGSDFISVVNEEGWPTLEELQSKFIFLISDGRAGPIEYAEDANPYQRLCFQRGNGRIEAPYAGYRLFWEVTNDDDDWFAYAQAIAAQPGLILRCWPTGDGDKARNWANAMACGVNIIGTDKVYEPWATVGQQPFWPITKKQWERQELISSGTCHSAPASAMYRDVMYVLTNDAPRLGYLTLDGGEWSNCKDTGSLMAGTPAAAVYHDVLWVAFRGKGGTNLWVTSYDGTSWNENKIGTAADSPGMAVYQDKVYLMYPRESDEKLVYRTYDGSGWSGEKRAAGGSESAPALCVFNNQLQAIYRGEGSGHVYIRSFDGSNWASAIKLTDINGVEAGKAPAVVVNGDEMLVVTRGMGSTTMYSFSIKKSGEISGQRAVTLGLTNEAVSLLNHEGEIWMFHRNQGDGGDHLFVQYLDTDY